MTRRDWQIGSIGVSLLAVAMLLFALSAQPPYSFYASLRWAVVIACGLGAWLLFTESKRYLPVCLALALLAVVFLFEKMHRTDWLLYDRFAIAALILTIVLHVGALKRKVT